MSRMLADGLTCWVLGIVIGFPAVIFGLHGLMWLISNIGTALDWING